MINTIMKKLGLNYFLLLIGLLIETSYLIYSIFENSRQSILFYMIIYAVTFILFFVAYLFVKNSFDKKNDKPEFLTLKRTGWNKSLVIIFIFGILFRITLIPTNYSTSDDVERYIWEGKILSNGYNPYEYPPGSKELEHLHSERLPAKVTFKNMTSIYPPISQIIFAAGYLISGENETGLKIIYLFLEILTFIYIIKLLRLRRLNENLIILYAWLPLPIMEYFINAHIDAAGITFFIMFLYYAEQSSFAKSIFAFTLAVAVKLFPLFLAPLLMKKFGFKKSLLFGFITAGLLLLIIFPFVPADKAINASLFTYLQNWSFNGSFYKLFETIFHNGYLARKITLVLFVLSTVAVSMLYKDFLKAVYSVWILFIAFAATLYPWYLGWIAVVNPFFNFSSIVYLMFAVNITNVTPMGEVWKEYWWVYLIQYIPFYVLLLVNLKPLFTKILGKK